MVLVKICGLTDEDAVHAALDAGANAIGFVFAESVRRIRPADAARLAADIPSDVRKVAVMKNPTVTEWQSVKEEFQPEVLQTDMLDFRHLSVDESIEQWPVYREGVSEPNRKIANGFLYEGKKSGSGESVDWIIAARYARHGHMILAGGLNADNVGAAIKIVRPWGVDVSSAVESEPGRKDAEKIKAFISAVRQAERSMEETA